MEKCLVCDGNKLESLILFYSRFLPKFFRRVSICVNCGHIQVYPMFNEKELKNINDRFFGGLYLRTNKQDHLNNYKKLNKLKNKLAPIIKENMNILDVGPGEAWALEYFQKNRCNYYAIESVTKLADSIIARGGEVIGSDIFKKYEKYNSFFDIIIFRHVLEHLLEPKLSLKILKNLLQNDGIIYLALPNAERPSKKKGFRTSFIRPVHVSYFHVDNVKRISHYAGLTPLQIDTSGEIFMLLGHSKKNDQSIINKYTTQKNVFLKIAKETLFQDYFKIATDLPKALIKNFIIH